MRKTTLIMMALLLAFPAIAATRTVDESRPAEPEGVVAIEAIAGSISVVGRESAEVHVTGTIDDEAIELKIESSGRRTTISAEPIKGSPNPLGGNVDLEIQVPQGSRIEAETVSADVSVEAIDGAVAVETISGGVMVAGDVPKATAQTVSGRIAISSTAELEGGDFQTVSGDIELKGKLSADGDFSFETVSGGIELHLPAGTSAEFKIETFNGDIRNDFGPEAERTSKYLPAKSLKFSLGGGGASVSISSVNGSVKLVRD